MKRPVTIKDVAQSAGVSIATVSYVLNQTRKVTDEVRQRVLRVSKELGYSRNNSARTLRTGKSQAIGLILPDLANPFFPELAQSVQHTARSAGYATIMIDTQNDQRNEVEALELLANYRVDGAVCALGSNHLPATPDFPVVLIDRPDKGYDCVYTDHEEGGRMVARYAREIGHRDLGLLSGPGEVSSAIMRKFGFREEAAGKLNIVWDIEVPFGGPLPPAAIEAVKRKDVSFVVAANDIVAIDVMDILRSSETQVPHDVSVIGFDDIPMARVDFVSLTTVRQPCSSLGEFAIRMLCERINEPGLEFRDTVMQPELIVRSTTRAIAQ